MRIFLVMRFLNAIVFVLVIAGNGLAATGKMSGRSIGLIANQYRSLFLPADYVFGIWSLIYLGLLILTIFQALPGDASTRSVRRTGPWWIIIGVLNVAWISTFSFSYFLGALAIMAVLLGALVVVFERVNGGEPRSMAEYWCVTVPTAIYLAWISVAIIANIFQYAHVVEWNGFGISESTYAVVMMIVATALGWLMSYARGAWVFPLVVAWALRGIGARYADLSAIAGPAAILVPAGIAGGLGLWWAGRRRAA
jgi:hypothetical protein